MFRKEEKNITFVFRKNHRNIISTFSFSLSAKDKLI